jgi:hypothetical protein
MALDKSFSIVLLLFATLLAGCEQEVIPTFLAEPVVEAKKLNLIFLDKADPTANVALYINNKLLKAGLDGSPKGLQQVTLSGSQKEGTLLIALADYETAKPPETLQVQNLLYEQFILPSEIDRVSTVVFSRENAGSRIAVFKSGLLPTEPAPDPGYFKIRFFNLSTSKLDVFNRRGALYQNFANLNVLEERAFQQLPFGSYRFTVRKQSNGGVIGTTTPVVRGEAGKLYNVICTDDGQFVTELGDFGVPKDNFAYVGFINLLPKYQQVVALPVEGSSRKEVAAKVYTKFDGVELVTLGTKTFTVEVGQEKLTATVQLQPYNYLMVMIVDNVGKPELRTMLMPMDEPKDEPSGVINARFFNFASDTAKVSFARIRTDVVLPGLEEPPATLLDLEYAANLKFGEIRLNNPYYTEGIYNQEFVNANTVYLNLIDSQIVLQAYEATDQPSKLGNPIAFARAAYPFTALPTSNYTVLLSGIKGEVSPELRPKITVISHSF